MQACYLLFKVSSVLFIHQHQIKEIAYRELLVDIPHGGGQVVSCKWTEDVACYHTISIFWQRDAKGEADNK